jgi:TusA-related sulfurtransferase
MNMLRTVESGQVLMVLGTDSQALKDFPRILARTDSQLIGVEQQPDYFKLCLRRGPAAEGGRSGGK